MSDHYEGEYVKCIYDTKVFLSDLGPPNVLSENKKKQKNGFYLKGEIAEIICLNDNKSCYHLKFKCGSIILVAPIYFESLSPLEQLAKEAEKS